jgi:hypothetical protein
VASCSDGGCWSLRDLPRTSTSRWRRGSAHSSCCSASTAPTRRDCCADTEHTLAMLDAGTFDLHLTAAAATAVPWPRCAPSTASPSWSRSASPRCGDCVVTASCPACGKRHVHGWSWDSVEPGARRPHCRFLSPHDYYIPRPARKLLAHFDTGPRSPGDHRCAPGARIT